MVCWAWVRLCVQRAKNANFDTEKCLNEFQAQILEINGCPVMADTALKTARLLKLSGSLWLSLALCGSVWAQESADGEGTLPRWISSEAQEEERVVLPGMTQPAVGVSVQRTEGSWLDDNHNARTEGFWRPIDSVALRAGYGQGTRSSLDSDALGWAATSDCGVGSTPDDQCVFLQRVSPTGANEIETYIVGASWNFSERFSLSLDYFKTAVEANSALSETGAALPLNKLIANPASLKPLPGLPGSERGVEVNMALNANLLGQLELGVQVAEIRQANRQLTADPLTRAVLDLGWSKGDFTGSLVSRHLSNARGGESKLEESWTTLDVKFAWRTPWNASLSVGAKNVLDTETSSVSNLEDAALDAGIDGVFGRVPYVRYEQDL